MARISLRAYNREIEGMVDTQQLNQAIAHCQHILRYFPKHINTYRLLGKAFLESQRYGDAADIFQRILSSVPDDFVSHVGMSIIREDEGNLDEAIWHMERAFDVQPANGAIQRELSRLFGRRDGLEPPKVRLTRGALARMYIKGDLYPQAISEIRTALAASPQSYDLLVLLAQAYYQAGQNFDAAEICAKLLKSLPYCLEANFLLGEILSNSDRSSEAVTFQKRALALDPYLTHLTPTTLNVENVPDSAVVLEKLVWSPDTASQQPAWASSLGVDLDDVESDEMETLPDWLADDELSPGATLDEEAIEEQQDMANQPDSEDLIPSWMEEAGWSPSSTEHDETQTPVDEELSHQDESIAPAEIPGWLQDIAPDSQDSETELITDDTTDEEMSSSIAKSTGSLPWLEDAPSDAENDETSWMQTEDESTVDKIESDQPEIEADLPDWLSEIQEPADVQDTSGEDQISDLSPFEYTEQVEIFSQAEELDVNEIEGLAEEHEDRGEDSQRIPTDELPDWIAESDETTQQDELTPSGSIEEQEEQSISQEDEEAFAWLEGLAQKQGSEDALLLSPEERRETPPEWVQDAFSEETTLSEITTGSIEETTMSEEGLVSEDQIEESTIEPVISDWYPEETTQEPTTKMTETIGSEDLPEWLRQEYEQTPPVSEAAEDVPEWLSQPTSDSEAIDMPEPPVQEEITIPHSDIMDETVDSHMLFSPAELDIEQPQPDQTEKLELEESPVIEGDTAPIKVKEDTEVYKDEIESIEVLADETDTEEQESPETVPEWLQGLVEDEQIIPEKEPSLAPPTSTPDEEIKEISEEVSETLDDDEAAFAWLESLAVKQGTDEALLLEPEERMEEPPEWIREAIADDQGENIEVSHERTEEELPPEIKDIDEQEIVEPTITSLEDESELIVSEDVDDLSSIAPSDELQELQSEQVDFGEPEIEGLETAVERMPELPDWLEGVDREIVTEADLEWQPSMDIDTTIEQPTLQDSEAETEPIDINQAGLSELEHLPGIGFIKAQAILEFREEHGPFASIEDLENVPGIGPVSLEEIRDRIMVSTVTKEVTLEPFDDEQITLMQARNALVLGEIDNALGLYTDLLPKENFLTDVINDLNEALYRFPVDIKIWILLGDAFVRSNQLSEALDAYTKAEELLR